MVGDVGERDDGLLRLPDREGATGDRTLQQADRTGATLDIIDPLSSPTSPLKFGGDAVRPDPDPGS